MVTKTAGHRKVYALRRAVTQSKSLEVTFPYQLIDREARKLGITIEQFLHGFNVCCEFDDSSTVTYTIVKRN